MNAADAWTAAAMKGLDSGAARLTAGAATAIG
jgi:hypothetical protein